MKKSMILRVSARVSDVESVGLGGAHGVLGAAGGHTTTVCHLHSVGG